MEGKFEIETLSRKVGTKKKFEENSSSGKLCKENQDDIDGEKLQEYCANHDYTDTFKNDPIAVGPCSNYRDEECINDEPCFYALEYAQK